MASIRASTVRRTSATMAELDAAARTALADFLARASGAGQVALLACMPLAGGTVHANWLLEVDIDGGCEHGHRRYVLRAPGGGSLRGVLSAQAEFAVMRAAHARGVPVPEALWYAAAGDVLAWPFFVMRFVHGTASAPAIIHDYAGDRARLVEQLGAALAGVQRLTPPDDLVAVLGPPVPAVAEQRIAQCRALLDSFDDPHPVIEWGLRWLERHAPPARRSVLVHGDYRIGNVLVADEGLTATLDWELARWGDPHEDLAWFLLRFWRLDRPQWEAGGVGSRGDLLRGYCARAGRAVDARELAYWEIMASARWAAIALEQARRHLSGEASSLELCLTGCRAAEIELELLRLLAQAEA